LSASVVLRADTDAEVSARKDALELAGAFGNDGSRFEMDIRAACLSHTITPDRGDLMRKSVLVFCRHGGAPKKSAVSVYDETGSQMTTENFSNGDKAAAGSRRRTAASTLYPSIRSRTRKVVSVSSIRISRRRSVLDTECGILEFVHAGLQSRHRVSSIAYLEPVMISLQCFMKVTSRASDFVSLCATSPKALT